MARSDDLKTPLCTFAFTNGFFKPRAGEEGGKLKYTGTLLFPKGLGLETLQEAAMKVAVEEWGEKAKQWIKDGVIKSPFLDGDGPQGVSKKSGERNKGFAGHTFVRVTSGEEYAPRLFNQKLRPATEAEFYSGVQGYAVVNAFTWENAKNGKGITFGISMAQIAKDGEKLGGGGHADPESFFEKIEDEGEAPAETKSGDGAAGLFG